MRQDNTIYKFAILLYFSSTGQCQIKVTETSKLLILIESIGKEKSKLPKQISKLIILI